MILELLTKSADDLDKITLEELNTWFAALLPQTRPELVQKETRANSNSSNNKRKIAMAEQLEFDRRMELARKLAAERGIKL